MGTMDTEALSEALAVTSREAEALREALDAIGEVVQRAADHLGKAVPDCLRDLTDAACCGLVTERHMRDLLDDWSVLEPKRRIMVGEATAWTWREFLAISEELGAPGWAPAAAWKAAVQLDVFHVNTVASKSRWMDRLLPPEAVVGTVMKA